MMLYRQSNNEEWLQLSPLGSLLVSFHGRPQRAAGARPATAHTAGARFCEILVGTH